MASELSGHTMKEKKSISLFLVFKGREYENGII